MHPTMHHLAAPHLRMMLSAKLTEYISECHIVPTCVLNACTVQYVLYSGKCLRQQLLQRQGRSLTRSPVQDIQQCAASLQVIISLVFGTPIHSFTCTALHSSCVLRKAD